MADYYDRLGAQLADLTTRRRRRKLLPPPALRPWVRTETAAVAAAVALVIAVSAVFLSSGAGHQGSPASQPVAAAAHPPPVIRNYSPHKAPPPGWGVVCDTVLSPPGNEGSSTGVALVYGSSSGRDALTITATGLTPNGRHDAYAVWITLWVPYAASPRLVGVVRPAVARDGRLDTVALLPRGASGAYQLLVTVQHDGSVKAPGRAVLAGGITF